MVGMDALLDLGVGGSRSRTLCVLFALAWVPWLGGCSAEWYRESADAEATAILQSRRKAELGDEAPFRVEQQAVPFTAVGVPGETKDLNSTPAPQPDPAYKPPPLPAADSAGGSSASGQSSSPPPPPQPNSPSAPAPDPGAGTQPTPPAEAAAANPAGTPEASSKPTAPLVGNAEEVALEKAKTVDVQVLSLAAALRLAFANNRNYQSQKESAYSSALALSLAQHAFAPRFLGAIVGDYSNDASGTSVGIGDNFGMNLLLMNGARLSINVLNNFAKFFTGDRSEVANSIVQGSFSQPLLRGFGTEIVREPLTQAERNVVYQIRSLERFRKDLAVQVMNEYYRVLQARDRVTNEYNNWTSLVENRGRVEALANAGRVKRFEVDQARQQEFQAQNTWISTVETYETTLDRYKLTLGIPTDSPVALDQSELNLLERQGIVSLDVSSEEAIRVALIERLDLKTVRDQVQDAERRSRVARDSLRAQLDFVADASLRSGDGVTDAQKPLSFDPDNLVYGFGLDLDLPLDRKAERNSYVESLIRYASSKRALSLQEDEIRLTVRDEHRSLEREILTYKIQQASFELAERRVESTTFLLEAGRAQTRDVLDSQAALLRARNDLTGSLISYAIARLEFLRDTEALRVDEEGRVTAVPIGGSNDV